MSGEVTIRRAEFPADATDLQKIFLGYLDFLFERSPEERENVIRKYDPARIVELAEKFAADHARPGGELLLAYLDGRVVGCAMMRELSPGTVEIQRVFVDGAARGRGLGRALVERLLERARADGQTRAVLDTGRALTEAIGLYRSMGFTPCAPYHDETPYLDHLIRYFERAV